jgi:3-phosphoshikimate 1-carboxyvinyltransferase
VKLVATPTSPLNGEAAIPGDKSCSHRALILGSMAEGETRISGLLESDDVLTTARAVKAFGASVERIGPGEWRVEGAPWRSPAPVECGNSGTTARLLMGAVAGMPGVRAVFCGDASL